MDLAAYFASRDTSQDTAASMPVVIRGASRNDLPALFQARGYQTGAEIGVYRGTYSLQLCQGIPGLHLLCVDRWCPYVSGKSGKTIFKSSIPAYAMAQEALAPYGCELIKKDSLEAAKDIPNRSLDFVYLDADHWFPAVVADIAAWLPKVRPGGVIAGHDYDEILGADNRVRHAVQGWTAAHEIVPWFVLGRHKVRRHEHRDPQRTWMWTV